MKRLVWILFLLWSGVVNAGERVVFFALGDQGSGNQDQLRVARAMEGVAARTGGVDFVVLLGDNFYPDGVSSERDPLWQSHFEEIYAGEVLSRTPFYPIVGNHDARSSTAAQVRYGLGRLGSGRWRMAGLNDLKTFGGSGAEAPLVRMAFLDATQPLEGQTRFLRAAFPADAPGWRLVASHYPLRSSGPHGSSGVLLQTLLPELRAAGVDLHLSGHDHDQEVIRMPGEPLYLVSGAGGQRLYPRRHPSPGSEFFAERFGFTRLEATRATLELTLYDDNGELLHRTRLTRPAP